MKSSRISVNSKHYAVHFTVCRCNSLRTSHRYCIFSDIDLKRLQLLYQSLKITRGHRQCHHSINSPTSYLSPIV